MTNVVIKKSSIKDKIISKVVKKIIQELGYKDIMFGLKT